VPFGLPVPARVLAFHPAIPIVQLHPDGEEVPARPGVHDRVGRDLRNHEHNVIGDWAAAEMAGHVTADLADLVGVAGVSPLVSGHRFGWRLLCCRRLPCGSGSGCGDWYRRLFLTACDGVISFLSWQMERKVGSVAAGMPRSATT
jgi:hypothetical protein